MLTFFEAKKGFTILVVSYRDHAVKKLAPLGLNLTEGNILHTLFNEGEGLNQETFVENLFLDKASISRNISTLIKKGFVIRKTDPVDRRAYKIFATEKAQKFKHILNEMFNDWLKIVVQKINPNEIEEAQKTFEKIIENAKKLLCKES